MIRTAAAALILVALAASSGKCEDHTTSAKPSYSGAEALVIDHTSVASFDRIPKKYLDKARELTLYYIHLSHGKQIITGLEAMGRSNPNYRVAVMFSSVPGLPPKENPPALRIYRESLGPESYWSTESGMERTRRAARMGEFNFSMYAWCGEMSSSNADFVNAYLKKLSLLETEFTNMRFIYMTGHVDGGSAALSRNNNLIREYAKKNGKVLFDFADIESYDPNGKYYSGSGRINGECSWCPKWCAAHPADCVDIPATCGHSDGSVQGGDPSMAYVCKLKAKAFWVMMARLAGWDGK